jgi:DNA-directed RNA polymerase subunit L
MALEANAEFKIKIFKNKMEFSIEGFNDSLKNGLKEILTAIQNINIT